MTSTTKWPRKGLGEPSCDIQVWAVEDRVLGLGNLESFILSGKSLQYLVRGIVLTRAPGSVLTIISLVPSQVGSWSLVKKATGPLDTFLVSMMFILSWEYLWGFAGDGNGETNGMMCYGKSFGRGYGLSCSGGMIVCLEIGWNGVLFVCLNFSGGSG